MFRSLVTIIRELYLYLPKVIFMLKQSVKLRRYIRQVMWQNAATSPDVYNAHHLIYITTLFYRLF